MNTFRAFVFFFCCVLQAGWSQLPSVNPFIGTGGHGHTYPGATVPFGMVQLSPDTRINMQDWDACSGYHYSDSLVYGFSHTHLSGTGVPDYCDVLFMPFCGLQNLKNDLYASPFKKNKEQATAGYYAVFLEKDKIQAELTATPRVGVHRYTFPKSRENGHVLIDLRHRDLVLDSYLEVVNDHEIAGYRVSRAWANEQHLYFVARFSKPFFHHKVLDMDKDPKESHQSVKSNAIVSILDFKNGEEPLVITVGISAVSIEGARKNLEKEAPDFDFDLYKANAQAAWQKQLSKINISGGTPAQQTAFYSALYHTMTQPNVFSDVDGQYRGRDQKIHIAAGHDMYSVFSLWDTYRACNPLYTILEPQRTNDFIQTFLRQYEQGGLLPIWELGANETDCMIGNHAIPVILDAWRKGIRGYDGAKALEAMQKSTVQNRLGLPQYMAKGYIPSDEEPESVSKTLEYAYDDWCVAQMAKDLGQKDVYETYIQRAQQYKNVFDPSTLFFRAKQNATWHAPFDPFEVNFNYTEANAWQYRFAAPQDVNGLMEIYGGKAVFAAQLDSLFEAHDRTTGRTQADITGLIGQYVQGNEPSHHMAYLYNYVGQPAKTQQRVRQIMDEMYTDQPDGLSGNEDCGQMSAWLVFSAMGFYPVVPGSAEYVIGAPLFEQATMTLENGKTFTVRAKNYAPANRYVKNVQLNGKDYPRTWFTHQTLLEGGEMVFEMSEQPSAWGQAAADCPVSKITDAPIVPVPFVKKGSRVFQKPQTLELGCIEAGAEIYYAITDVSEIGKTIANSRFKKYKQPFLIKKTGNVVFYAQKNGQKSPMANARFDRLNASMKIVRYNTRYNNQYTARGDNGLIDLLRGGADFRSGGWQGYEGVNLDVVIDLGKLKKVNKVTVGFLQDENSWIFFPTKLQVEISEDGKNFRAVGEKNTSISPEEKGSHLQDLAVALNGAKARYIRVVGVTLGQCPSTHKGAGYPCWLFADEILVD